MNGKRTSGVSVGDPCPPTPDLPPLPGETKAAYVRRVGHAWNDIANWVWRGWMQQKLHGQRPDGELPFGITTLNGLMRYLLSHNYDDYERARLEREARVEAQERGAA